MKTRECFFHILKERNGFVKVLKVLVVICEENFSIRDFHKLPDMQVAITFMINQTFCFGLGPLSKILAVKKYSLSQSCVHIIEFDFFSSQRQYCKFQSYPYL